MKQALSAIAVMLALGVLCAPVLCSAAEDLDVEVTLEVEPVFDIFLKKNTATGPDWTESSTTLTAADFVAGEKNLDFVASNLNPPNPTGRVWYRTNTNAVVTVELGADGNFSDGGLELWVRQNTSLTYVEAVEGSPTQLFTAVPTTLGNRQIWLRIDNITWENTAPGEYSETLVFTIQEP
jgi:hypothetical protein